MRKLAEVCGRCPSQNWWQQEARLPTSITNPVVRESSLEASYSVEDGIVIGDMPFMGKNLQPHIQVKILFHRPPFVCLGREQLDCQLREERDHSISSLSKIGGGNWFCIASGLTAAVFPSTAVITRPSGTFR